MYHSNIWQQVLPWNKPVDTRRRFNVYNTLKRRGLSTGNNTPQIEISVKYIVYKQFMAASAVLKNTVSIEEWVAAIKEAKKACILEKTVPYCYLTVTYKKKMTLDHSPLFQ